MSQVIAPPPPAPKKTGTRRRALPWLSSKPETRSIQIGVLATILVHLFLLMLAPRLLDLSGGKTAYSAPKPVDIDLSEAFLPPPPPKPAPKPPMRFVEANPNAPENIPDKTNNFSDRNQQVAQEKPTPNGKSEMPALTGRKDLQSTAIVTGQMSKPQESVPPTPPKPTAQKPPSTATPLREQDPLPGFEKRQGDSPDGFATNTAKSADNPKAIPQKIDGAKDAPLLENATASTPQIDPKHPQPRRTLDLHVRPAIFTQNDVGSSNMGVTALNSKFSNYGVYLKRLFETVEAEWYKILSTSQISPNPGSMVTIRFSINSRGEIKMEKVDPSAGTSDAASRACASAIADPQPYGEWSDDMKATLNPDGEDLVITFLYE